MQVKSKKNMHAPLSKGQTRLLQESLKKLLGTGLVDSTPKSHEEIKPIILRVVLDSQILNS